MIQRIIVFFCLFLSSLNIVNAGTQPYILKDLSTNQILEKNEENVLVPMGSMVRLVILYSVLDELEKQKIGLTEKVRFAAKKKKVQIMSLKVQTQDTITYQRLLKAYLITGFDDIGEFLIQSLWKEKALQVVQRKMRQIPLDTLQLHQLQPVRSDSQSLSVKDALRLSRVLIQRFPRILEWSQRREFVYKKKKFANTNVLLGRNVTVQGLFLQEYKDLWSGVIYSKNQVTTDESREILLVRMNQDNQQDLSRSLSNLLVSTYRDYSVVPVFKKNEKIAEIPVLRGDVHEVTLEVQRDVYITFSHLQFDDYKKENLLVQLEYQSPLVAPIQKGQNIGYLKLFYDGIRKARIPVYATHDVEKGSWWDQLYAAFKFTFLKL